MRKNPYLYPVILGLVLLIVSFVNGLLLPPKLSDFWMSLLTNYLKKVTYSFPGIFINNLATSSLLLLGGFLFAIPSIFSFYVNFMLLGVAVQIFGKNGGLFKVFVSVAPHGLFEIPAIFLSLVYGLVLASALIQLIRDRDGKFFIQRLNQIGILFLKTVVPMLFIAALIEVYITPVLVKMIK